MRKHDYYMTKETFPKYILSGFIFLAGNERKSTNSKHLDKKNQIIHNQIKKYNRSLLVLV